MADVRIERDLIGARELPLDARYGVHAARAVENFARPGAQLVRDVPEFCQAFGMVKFACAQANMAAGVLDPTVGAAISTAAVELVEDDAGLREELLVPLVQGGAGTSTNMNVNEVLANRALEIMGHPHGAYEHCHPNDHVNRSQSTNDVYPTALRIALIRRGERLEASAGALELALREVAGRVGSVTKLGRTQLQDAVPMLVADEFHAWADALRSAIATLASSRDALAEVNLGGTALGTGLTAPAAYQAVILDFLVGICGRPLRRPERLVSATTDCSALLAHSAALRALAVAMAKLANDLRLLGSGPRTGLGELRLPAVQGGSSMMPGKVNPVIAEFVNQLAFRVRGSDLVVADALDAGQLQLHAMLPVVASALFAAQQDLACGATALCERCIAGLSVDERRVEGFAALGLGELSEIAAASGYQHASRLAMALGAAAAAPGSAAIANSTTAASSDRGPATREG